MLANNNNAIINKLAKNTFRTNKKQFRILFITVALSSFMLFAIFTIGLTYLDLSRLQNTRLYGSEYDIVIMNGFSDDQKETVEKNSAVQTVGTQSYSGYVKSTDTDDTITAGLLWGDQTFWDVLKKPARTSMKGHYPKEANELLATKEVLNTCGKSSLSIGDYLEITYEDNTGVHTKEFVISGIWDGYGGDKANFYVSEKFYNQSGYNLENSGIMYIKLKNNFVSQGTIENLERSLTLSPQQQFQPSDYIERSLTILLALCGLCLIICLSAYLLIYNILYLSVSGKIRYYGLLQALGMTKKQLVLFIKKQMFKVGILGIVTGLFLGIFISIFLIPYVMQILGISLGNTGIHFYPIILLVSGLATGIAILCGIRTPIHIATDVTPVEATRYRVNDEKSPTRKKSKKGSLYWKMAKDQLKKDKKKTTIVFLSLAVSLTVFYCLTTIISSQGERTVYPNYWEADFIIKNDTQTTEDFESLQPAINEDFITELNQIEGIREIHMVKGIPVIYPYQPDGFSGSWIKGYTDTRPFMSYDDTISDYQENPEKYYGMLKAIDEAEFDYLNETLNNAVNKQDFLSGKVAVLQYSGFEIPENSLDKPIQFSFGNNTQEIEIGAISYTDYYGGSFNIGANLIVSEEYLNSLVERPYILSLLIKYEQMYDENTENEVKSLIQESNYSNDLSYTSIYDEMKTIQDSQGNMLEIGTVIALLLLLIGMLNYINTMASNMQNRKLTFSIMESVGMSRKQIRKLLIREGLLYAFGSIFITLTVGTGITYVVFQSMNYMEIPFSVPILPLLCAIILVTIICVATLLFSYNRTAGSKSIVERLREYE